MPKLVIVESPTKVKTIKKYLGANYDVVATMGHIRDLPESRLSVDVKKNFRAKHMKSSREKKSLWRSLKEKAEACRAAFCSQPTRTREGEASPGTWPIFSAWTLPKRIGLRLTRSPKQASLREWNTPRSIDQNLVNAQQARRVLDRLVGYKLSPFLSRRDPPRLVCRPRAICCCGADRGQGGRDPRLQAGGILDHRRQAHPARLAQDIPGFLLWGKRRKN